MAKPEWGVKRTCQSCGARFYDMQRAPIICPKCGSNVEPEVIFKPRRQSAALAAAAAAEAKAAAAAKAKEAVLNAEIENEELEVADDEEADINAIDGGDDDESGLIEDASDLGEDDDDMAEVMEHLDGGLEDEV